MGPREERRARSDARLRTARKILTDLELLTRWSKYGEALVVGSVGVGLVVQPDIDIDVFSDEPRVLDGFAVMGPLAELPQTRSVTYLDARDRPEQGQYWKVDYELTADETWTIDIWVFDRDRRTSTATPLAEAVRRALTDETSDRILAIKEEAAARGERAYGYWLYQAVMDAGVRSYPQFRAWLGDRNIYERTGWRPTEDCRPDR
jgi:hypothetical protein